MKTSFYIHICVCACLKLKYARCLPLVRGSEELSRKGGPTRDLMMEIYSSPEQVKSVNNTNIVLIPKVDQLEYIRDFRPSHYVMLAIRFLPRLLATG